MLACFGQQGTVITVAQVFVAAAQVYDLHTLACRGFQRLFQIILGADQVFAGEVRCPVFKPFDNNHQLPLRRKKRCGVCTSGCC